MELIKVRFILNITIKDTDSDKYTTAKHINEVVIGTANSVGGHNYYEKANKFTLPNQKGKIDELLLIDFNFTPVAYQYTEYEFPEIRRSKTTPPYNNRISGFEYDFSFKLVSVVYNCIDILPDQTFVCYRDDDKEIRFIKASENITATIA